MCGRHLYSVMNSLRALHHVEIMAAKKIQVTLNDDRVLAD
jgi:hypothetical protein